MPRTCTVCAHADREAIDKALLAGEPYRSIARQYGLSEAACWRHKAEHISDKLAKSAQAVEVTQADDLLGEMEKIRKVTWALLGRAAAAGDIRTAVAAAREARNNLELLGRLTDQLQRQAANVNIVVLPEWLGLRTRILGALTPYPDARAAVVAALGNGDVR